MTAQWLDFKELRKRIDFAEVLKHYGVELKVKRGNQHQGFCPLPTHQGRRRSPSFSANLSRGCFQCFGCGKSGGVLDFVSLMEGADPNDGRELRRIGLLLADRFGAGGHTPPAQRRQPDSPDLADEAQKEPGRVAARPPAVVNAPLDFALKGLDSSHPYLSGRGFTPETIAHFGLGYCGRGLMNGRIAIPLHDARGRLLGYAGRLADDAAITAENPKYRFPGPREREGKVYEVRKSLFLYNQFAVGHVHDLIVVEGFASTWWLWQHGHPNTVALMGCSCSEEQLSCILEACETHGTVRVFPDGDSAGERCAEAVLKAVSPHRSVRWVRLGTGEQPTGCTADELAGLLGNLEQASGTSKVSPAR